MKLSRRDLLRAGGGSIAAFGLAGCVEERVTRRESRIEDTSTWTLSPDTADVALSAEAFEDYAERMEDRYGDSGVWGLEAERDDDFEMAYVQRYAITHETAGSPVESELSLVPDEVDPDAPVLIADACVAAYDLEGERHRYWLWIAADSTDTRLVRDVALGTLSIGVRLRNGVLADAASASVSGQEATVDLGTPPSGTFPLRGGTVDTATTRGREGSYSVRWNGELDGVQSVNGVCEEERANDYDLFWTTSLGYRREETV